MYKKKEAKKINTQQPKSSPVKKQTKRDLELEQKLHREKQARLQREQKESEYKIQADQYLYVLFIECTEKCKQIIEEKKRQELVQRQLKEAEQKKAHQQQTSKMKAENVKIKNCSPITPKKVNKSPLTNTQQTKKKKPQMVQNNDLEKLQTRLEDLTCKVQQKHILYDTDEKESILMIQPQNSPDTPLSQINDNPQKVVQKVQKPATSQKKGNDLRGQSSQVVGNGATAKKLEELVVRKQEPAAKKQEQPVAKIQEQPAVKQQESPAVKKQDQPIIKKQNQPILKKQDQPTIKKQDQPIMKSQEQAIIKKQDQPVEKKHEQVIQKQQATRMVDNYVKCDDPKLSQKQMIGDQIKRELKNKQNSEEKYTKDGNDRTKEHDKELGKLLKKYELNKFLCEPSRQVKSKSELRIKQSIDWVEVVLSMRWMRKGKGFHFISQDNAFFLVLQRYKTIVDDKEKKCEQIRKERVKQQKEVDLRECTFKPNINDEGDRRKVHEFLAEQEEWLKKHEEKIMTMKHQQESDEIAKCTYRPAVSPNRKFPGKVEDRLLEKHFEKLEKLKKIRENEVPTFQPNKIIIK